MHLRLLLEMIITIKLIVLMITKFPNKLAVQLLSHYNQKLRL